MNNNLIKNLVPVTYLFLAEQYDNFTKFVARQPTNEDEDPADELLYRTFWLVIELHFFPNITRQKVAQEIEDKFMFNNRKLNRDLLRDLNDTEKDFMTVYNSIPIEDLHFMGL